MSCLQAILHLPTQSWHAVVQHGTASQDCRDFHPRGGDMVSNNGKSWRDYPESQVKSTDMPPRASTTRQNGHIQAHIESNPSHVLMEIKGIGLASVLPQYPLRFTLFWGPFFHENSTTSGFDRPGQSPRSEGVGYLSMKAQISVW